ncbi:hypothetical protein S40288_00723 [Stachybotrys chartarum IBT 40288]|nr:hypothetical protein S40288_00723 [Stachybotrys chartarum IBT 40288]
MKRLAPYIESVYYNGKPPNDHRPFNHGSAQSPPLLRPHGMNRLLVFPGSFNPPHRGHSDLLSFAFRNAGDDMHVTGAIILLTDDNRLIDKNASVDNALVLPKETRAQLCRAQFPDDWAWVYDGSEDSWPGFQKGLVDKLQKDRIELKFMLLGGPDWFSVNEILGFGEWGCDDCITSDVSRPVDFRHPYNMMKLPNCSAWNTPRIDFLRLEKQIQAKLRNKSKQEIEEAVNVAYARLKAISVCRRLKSKGYVRFTPCNLELRPKEAPSSTKIRELIAASTGDEQLAKALGCLVTNPQILIDCVQAHRKSTGLVVQE